MNDDLPELAVDMPVIDFDFQSHNWHQEGYSLICNTCPQFSSHGTNINPGLMLVGNRGEWELVAEGGIKKT